MESRFRAMLAESANTLRIEQDSPTFRKALEVGTEALRSGFDAEVAYEFARRVLLEPTIVTAA